MPPTQEEVVQEAAKSLVDSLRTLATNNPTYTHLSNFSGLQQISDLINSAAKKASDSKSQESQGVAPPKIPERQRVGPNIIEDDSGDTRHQLRDKKGIKRIQQICGSILWYMRACDITTTKELNANGREQSKATETTRMWSNWLLDYLATHPDAKIRYWQSDMRLLIHSDASFLV